MNAVEKLRKLLTGKMPNGKTRSEACAQSHVGYALTIGDCAELLQEIDRLRAALKSIAERKCYGRWGGACGEADSASREAEDALEHFAAEQNRPSAEVEAIERCVHCGVKLEIEGDSGHCLSCTRGGQQP